MGAGVGSIGMRGSNDFGMMANVGVVFGGDSKSLGLGLSDEVKAM